MFDKKLPWQNRDVAFSLGFGVYWQSQNKYIGARHSPEHKNELQLLLRPSIDF